MSTLFAFVQGVEASQKIQYAKGRSAIFNKLEGEYKPLTTAPTQTTSTDLQQSIFNALPSTNLPAIPPPATNAAPKALEPAVNGTKSEGEGPQGVKRRRDDESDEGEAPMDEDDDDVSMEASSDEE